MTNENELIRRGDAIGLFEGPDTCPIQFDYGEARERIAAIPAVADTPEVLALRNATRKVNNILADIADFDGDRRGHYGALEEAERKLIDAAIAAIPAVAVSQPADLHDATKAQLAECEARLRKAMDALTVSASRLAWVTVQFGTGTNNFITVGEWADQACAVLAEIEKGEPK